MVGILEPMLSLAISLILATPAASDDVAKALEFQYQQKYEALKKENASLLEKITVLEKKSSRAKNCSSEASLEKSTTLSESASDYAAYQVAFREVQNENWNDAIVLMEQFVREYSTSDLADNALFWIAQIYLQKDENELARSELERLLATYPKGDRAKRAQAILLNIQAKKTERQTN